MPLRGEAMRFFVGYRDGDEVKSAWIEMGYYAAIDFANQVGGRIYQYAINTDHWACHQLTKEAFAQYEQRESV